MRASLTGKRGRCWGMMGLPLPTEGNPDGSSHPSSGPPTARAHPWPPVDQPCALGVWAPLCTPDYSKLPHRHHRFAGVTRYTQRIGPLARPTRPCDLLFGSVDPRKPKAAPATRFYRRQAHLHRTNCFNGEQTLCAGEGCLASLTGGVAVRAVIYLSD